MDVKPPRPARPAPEQQPERQTVPPAQQTPPETAEAEAPARESTAVDPAPVESGPLTLSRPRDGRPTTRVALLLPLSGPSADAGQALLNAAQMALFDVAGQEFELLPVDTKGTPRGAESAVAEAVNQDAGLILGPLFSRSVKAARGPARQARLPMVAFSNDLSLAGDGVYMLGFMPQAQVRRVVSHVRGEGRSRFAALMPDTTYGRTVLDAYRTAVQQAGGELVRVRLYNPAAEDYSDLVKAFADYESRHQDLLRQRRQLEQRDDRVAEQALKRLEGRDTVGGPGFDALMLADDGTRLRSVAALLPYYDVDPGEVRMMGTMLWNDPLLGREPALDGARFAAPPPDRFSQFAERFEHLYGGAPSRLAALGFDAVALAAVLARGETGFTPAALTDPNGFAGVNGIFRLTPEGRPQRGLAVLELGPDGIQVRDPAPDSFQQAVF